MEKGRSLKKNMVMSAILTGTNFIVPVITYSYAARILSPVGTGKVAFVNSFIQYVSYIATLGIPMYGLRECAKIRDDKEKLSHTVQELLIINMISTVIAYITLFVATICVDKLYNYRDLILVMSIYIVLNTIGLEWLYQALEEYTYITIRSVMFKIISIFLTYLMIRTSDDYIWYGFISIFTVSASYICNLVNIRKYISLKKNGKYNLKRHLKPIFTLFFATVVVGIYANFDVSMLGFIRNETEVGLYNSAYKIRAIVASVSTAITAVIIPRMSYYLKDNNKEASLMLCEKSLRISFLIAFPLAIYIAMFSKKVLAFLCGDEFVSAEYILIILMISVGCLIFTNLFGNQILIPNGMEKRYSQSVFVGLWINLLLNFALIPRFGAEGAAFATLVTELWNVIWMSSGASEYLHYIKNNISFMPYIVAVVASGVLSKILQLNVLRDSLSNFLILAMTSVCFFAIYFGLLIILKEPTVAEQINSLKNRIKCNR